MLLYISLLVFIISLYLWAAFDNLTAKFQYVEVYNWIGRSNINFYLGIDGISLFFVILTTLLIPICILASWDAIKSNVKEYMIAFLFLEAFVIAVFCVLDSNSILCIFRGSSYSNVYYYRSLGIDESVKFEQLICSSYIHY